jgi:hypothetical protein
LKANADVRATTRRSPSCEGVGQFLREAVAEVLLVPRGRHVGERQDDQRRPGPGFSRRLARTGRDRDQSVAALRDRLDEPRLLRIIAEQLPQVGDRAGEDGLRDEALLPHALEDLVLRDHLAGLLGEEHEQVHQPRSEVTDDRAPRDSVQRGLDEPVGEMKRRTGGGRFHDRGLYAPAVESRPCSAGF